METNINLAPLPELLAQTDPSPSNLLTYTAFGKTTQPTHILISCV